MVKNKQLLTETVSNSETVKNSLIELHSTDLSEEVVEKQEHLSTERLKNLTPLFAFDVFVERPTANLIDLMHWVKDTFSTGLLKNYRQVDSNPLKNKENLQCYIHNKIVIDGAFLQFCEENDVKVECLMRDSIASWKTDHNSEHFMVQGIFRISTDKFDFLHCALFHKGNQNEDEVSFFIIASDDIFEQYIELRNKFDKWLVTRDRDHLEIHVCNAEGYPYTRDHSWDDVFLEEDLKKDIKNYIEGFLKSKHIYEKLKVPWKSGCIFFGSAGVGKTSLIRTIIANYNFKPVTVQSGTQTNDDTITEAFEYASHQEPALLYIEDFDTLLGQTISLSHFLNMLDGVSSKNGLMVICTANDLSKLKESVVDRPSRFDRKFEFPVPNFDMTVEYLTKWFGDILKPAEYKKIANETVDMNFSFAYLKELYIGSIYTALSDGRETPTIKDVNITKKRMIKDKENVKNNFELSNNGDRIGL